MVERHYYTLHEAADVLRISVDALRMRIARGQLRAYRPSPRVIYLRRDEVAGYVEGCPLHVEAEASRPGTPCG